MSANPHPAELRYVVVWSDSVERHETYIRERALADAYAAKHHGIVVVLANLSAWPGRESGCSATATATAPRPS